MTRPRTLLIALAAAAGVAGTAGAARWRLDALRDGLRGRVGTRLAGTAALTRDATVLWVRERERDVARVGARTAPLPAGAPARSIPTGDGYTGGWVVRAGAPDPTGVLTAAELAAAAHAAEDGCVHLVGPFAAETPSGVAVSVIGPATGAPAAPGSAAPAATAPSAVVLRADPARTLLPLVVRRVTPGTELARLVALDSVGVHVMTPAEPGAARPYVLRDAPAAALPAFGRAVLGDGAAPASAQGSYVAPDGREVMAVFERVPGTAWAVKRQVDAAEIDVHAWDALRTEGALLLAALTAVGLGAFGARARERTRRLRERVRVAEHRAQADEALRASEAGARAFVEHSPYGICRVSPDGRFTEVNPALVRMLGYPDAGSLLRADLGDLYVDPAARAHILRRHAEGEAMVSGVETAWRRADGGELPVRLHSREVRDAAGAIAYYEAYVKDLGPLRSAEQALRQAEKLAAVGGFVSGVAHELNNPLSAVLLFAEGLMDDEDRTADDREALSHVRDQALRARAIVRDLLAFVRGAGGSAATVRARDVLERAARALAPQVAVTGGRLETAFPPDLGWIRVDRAGLEQVVTNLVLNAAQAAPGGTVRLAAAREDTALRVTVDDSGPGLPPAVLERMFEPFFTTKPVGEGTGLGLSVSLGIVERHGGTLTAANRPAGEGTGARLTITLPLVPRPADVAEQPAAAPVTRAPAPRPEADGAGATGAGTPGRPPRVLIVDDEATIRLALLRFFGRRGWAVDEAGDGRAAFARLLDAEAAGAPYDLVLSDVRMPDVSGIALHDWVARTRPVLLDRLVFATGDLASPESAAFVARTRCQVLEKPFEPGALDALARRAVGEPAVAV